MKRAAYFALYGLFAALGAGLLARPALLYLRGLGLLRPALPWNVSLGPLLLALLVLLAVFTLRLAIRAALGNKPRPFEHALFLALTAAAFAARLASGDPVPPRDPNPTLIAALRAVADSADAHYSGSYSLESLTDSLTHLTPPGFRHHARLLPLRVVPILNANGPSLEAELPGTILVAINPDRTRLWLTAVTLHKDAPAILSAGNKPLVLQARAGTHSAPGRDPLVPTYPGMKPARAQ